MAKPLKLNRRRVNALIKKMGIKQPVDIAFDELSIVVDRYGFERNTSAKIEDVYGFYHGDGQRHHIWIDLELSIPDADKTLRHELSHAQQVEYQFDGDASAFHEESMIESFLAEKLGTDDVFEEEASESEKAYNRFKPLVTR